MGLKYSPLLWVLFVSFYVFAGNEEPAWKDKIVYPDDPFQSWTSPAYIKFSIIIREGYDPNLVDFQDCRRYEYHFDFAFENLEPFIGMTLEEFDNVTGFKAGQQAVLGAVIMAPWTDPPINEYGIQFVRHDAYSREEILKWFDI